MSLRPGARLGAYEVVALIGAGGMGEVYRARDTKLSRDVAVKVLPEAFALDPDRLARLTREAQVLASLNHPNIAAIYGFDESNGVQALVLELVEGDTLADRIVKGPIPIDEALPIARQIAEALEAAHEHGVIHRDLKPANVKLRLDGTVKVLDFGLAKALAPDASTTTAGDLSQSPTMAPPAATRMGVILGTAAYMAPEQAKGKPVDKRADIWAFGCVLFEMLTGRHAFAGETITDILVSVVTKEPDWLQLPPATPIRLRQLLTRLLRKDVRARLQHAGDARIEIVDILAEPSDDGESRAAGTRPRRTAVTFALTAVATAALSGLVVWSVVRPRESAVPAVTRVPVALPRDQRFVAPQGLEESPGRYPAVALSEDGRKLAYAASTAAGAPQLYLRELDAWETRALAGTESAELPFFSPDGTWVGFLADGAVFKMPSSGGARVKIADLPLSARGAAWGPNETIILGGANTGLLRLDAGGGQPRQITRPDSARGEQYHAWPDVLPGGTHVLFTAATHDSSSIGVLSLETGKWHVLEQTEGAAQPRYLDSGHLVFFRAAGLFGMPFDLSTTETMGSPVQVVSDVFPGWNAGLDIGYFAVSRSGSLVYVPGDVAAGQNRLVHVDRQGREAALPAEPGRYGYTPSVSPDGQRLVVSTNAPRANSDLWVHDLARGTRIRLTSRDANIYAVWTADGKRVIFSLFKTGAPSFDLYSIAADGSGKPEPLLVRDFGQFPTSSSRDGRFVAFEEENPKTGQDIHVASLSGDHVSVPFLATSANEQDASFSPDGRFLAYSSNESGRFEVYVQRFPSGGGKSAISTNGGRWPRWSLKGDELFYREGSAMMAVTVAGESTFRAGTPRALFDGRYAEWYDVTADAGTFVLITKEQAVLTGLNLVLNWVEELKRLVPNAR